MIQENFVPDKNGQKIAPATARLYRLVFSTLLYLTTITLSNKPFSPA